MNKFGKVIVYALVVFSTGCAVKVPVQIPKLTSIETGVKRTEKVLLTIDEKMRAESYEIKQLLAIFQYDLGGYLSHAIETSLKANFNTVELNQSKQKEFDLTVKPELEFFEAPVPALVFLNTEVKIRLKYLVTPRSPRKPYTLMAEGTYELKSDKDKEIYSTLASRSDFYFDASTGIAMNIPNYSYEAGKDTYIAIYHVLIDLNNQLIDKLKNT